MPFFIIMNIHARSFFSGALMLQWVSWCLVLIMSCIFLVSESLWSHNVGDVLRQELGCCSVALHEVPRGERSHLEAGLQPTFLQYEQDSRGCWLVSCWPSFHCVLCELQVGTLHSSSPCRTCMQCIRGGTEKPGRWLLLFRKMPHSYLPVYCSNVLETWWNPKWWLYYKFTAKLQIYCWIWWWKTCENPPFLK